LHYFGGKAIQKWDYKKVREGRETGQLRQGQQQNNEKGCWGGVVMRKGGDGGDFLTA